MDIRPNKIGKIKPSPPQEALLFSAATFLKKINKHRSTLNHLNPLGVFAIFLAIVFLGWLWAGINNAKWAIELVGGNKVLSAERTIATEDILFFGSVNPSISREQAIEILSISVSKAKKSCQLPSESCLNNNLSIANILALSHQKFPTAKWFIDTYSSASTEDCPIKVELSNLIYETSRLTAHPNKPYATKLLHKIKNNGGLNNSLSIPQCEKYLISHSHFARAYIFYLSILMSMSDYSPYSAWIYLLFKSKYEI